MESCAICLIVKDENPEIAEWVAHYCNLGADRLIIYDNGSTDGTRELLSQLSQHFPITIIDWPGTQQQQQKAYSHCLGTYADSFDWIAFFDADEFLIPPPGETLKDLLERHAEHSAIGVFWLIFGTSRVIDLNGNTVMESLTRCSQDSFFVNRHIKSIVRPKSCDGFYNVHCLKNVRYFDPVGRPIDNWEIPGIVNENVTIPAEWRLHHYLLRTETHIDRRKRRVGGAADNSQRDENFYVAHNRNEIKNFFAVSHGLAARNKLAVVGYNLFPSKTPPIRASDAIVILDRFSPSLTCGWVNCPDDEQIPEALQLYIDDNFICETKSWKRRVDVELQGFNGNYGFELQFSSECLDGGSHQISLRASPASPLLVSYRGGKNTKVLTLDGAEATEAFGSVDGIFGEEIHGWCYLKRNGAVSSATLTLLRDGEKIAEFAAGHPRPDVAASIPEAPPDCGFKFTIPSAHRTAEEREFRVLVKECPDFPLPNSVVRRAFAQASAQPPANPTPELFGHIDGFKGATLQGWVFLRNPDGATQGKLTVEIWQDGKLIAETLADAPRNDVLGAHPGAPNFCGLKFTVPEALRRVKACTYEITVKGGKQRAFPGNTFQHSFAPDLDLGHSREWYLSDYETWLRMREADLKQRAAETDVSEAGLVSVVCPVYKPNLMDLMAAINSVIAQTYANWELILVNDGSRMPALSALLSGYELWDERIKIVQCATNRGIATATNRGLEEARGNYVAFLDQDDLLSPFAFKFMLGAALRTGAHLIYSDEDKLLDEHRCFPAFKPDWNWRYLLGVNYICHFVMVTAALLKRVGPLDPELDAAQDHDFLLRASEHLTAERVCHVPEILYTWRMAPGSTSGGAEAKPHSIEAGAKAVSAHLNRKGLPAVVSARKSRTWYHIRWTFSEERPVRIIIPYKEEIDMTRDCLNRVLGLTDYNNYEVVLVDNGSASLGAARFREEAAKMPQVRVIKNDEPFNYSRLNNQAARLDAIAGAVPPEYFLLLNNDVFVKTGDWLRRMVDETLADPDVAIVGAKLFYKDGTVQHAGVIAGLGGVAGHYFRLKDAEEEGYMGRAALPNQVSVVTAACMLVEADAFWRVGGLTEALPAAFNDVDLCLKMVYDAKRKIVVNTEVVADHLESATRGIDDMDPVKYARFVEAFNYMQERWGERLDADPFYNPNFSLNDTMAYEKLRDPTLPHDASDRPTATAKPRYLSLAS